jgi:xylose dehydrogenase (NAD/NADP)
MLSTARIGRIVAGAIRGSAHSELVAVAGRDPRRAAAFAAELGIPRSVGSYQALLADDGVDAIYIPLPIALHSEWTVRALQAGKHVLCEKPLAPTAAEAAACFDVAQAAGLLCIEGLMWRHHPKTLLAQRLVADGSIGRLAYIRAALTVNAPPGDIRRTGRLGGGATLDLGCYCISAIRLFGGQPLRVAAEQVVDMAEGADGGDLRLAATLALPGDVLAQFDVALDFPRRDELELIGTTGKIIIPDPWICRRGYIELEQDGVAERLPADPTGEYGLSADPDNDDAYRLEFAAASRAIEAGTTPAFGRTDAVDQAAVIEAVRQAAATSMLVEPPAPTTPTHLPAAG